MRTAAAALTLISVAVVAGYVTVSAWAETEPTVDNLQWTDCGERLQCATLPVPVDWADPDGTTTEINLARIPAAGDSQGSLIANFGAGNSTSILRQPPPAVARLAESFDLVVFDPRGLGQADNGTLVECPTAPAPLYGLMDARSEADWTAHAEINTEYDTGCQQAAGDGFAGLNSWQIAHDLDRLREVLGESHLRYFGNSYGGAYAQAYISLFPERVGSVVVDGVPDHTQPDLAAWLENYALAGEQQLTEFDQWCAGRPGCAAHEIGVIETFDRLAEQVRRAPLPAPGAGDGAELSEAEFFSVIHKVVTMPPVWPQLAVDMSQALDGDASGLATWVEQPDPDEPGYLQAALLCHDFMPRTPDFAEAMAIEAELKQVAPRLGWVELRFELARCNGISSLPAYPPAPLEVEELAPVLVLIGDVDNNTPHLGAENVAGQLPGAGVVRHGDGHAAFMHGNSCLGDHVIDYFESGTVPPSGATCPGELVDRFPDRP
ncbi:tripeptidyl-peptidase C [Stackebrandtia endophytica]|uniref:Tripeptidyl-peptidase C n=1 Tax=Stackebrandtia endophytica TaxID=1496996 RepID=A0A543B3J1_9ACTN|nr:alpha/beta fold hydrolase [Stackebrandtia endophytica]TQL79340.1 tripeptidyl-peptidase C [Stackebrandtia endophytica]